MPSRVEKICDQRQSLDSNELIALDNFASQGKIAANQFNELPIDNDNTRGAYGRALGSFFVFLEGGGRERVQDIGPLDVRDDLEAAKTNDIAEKIEI